MLLPRLYAFFARRFRPRRMRLFLETFSPSATTRILDIGGTPYNWLLVDCPAQITLLNLGPLPAPGSFPERFHFVHGDATRLDYPDDSFDIVFSNSVIEHVGTLEAQRRFAAEARRVAPALWIQSPARSFPVEPHLLTPLVHYLPRPWRRRLIRNGTIWGLLTRPTPEQVDHFVDTVRLLDAGEMVALFPDCTLHRERWLGLTKSYIMVRRHRDPGRSPAI